MRKMRILFLMRRGPDEGLVEGLDEGLDEGLIDMSGSQDQCEQERAV